MAFRGAAQRFFCLFALLALLERPIPAATPTIIITNLPAYGSFSDLSGIITGASPNSNAIAVFIYVPGYGWVTKPTCAQPLTLIQPDGSWSADITTGGSDQLATRIAALLVSTNYNQLCVLGSAYLSTNIFAEARAAAIVTRQSPGLRWLNFSDYDWWVKSSAGPVGPGPNYFSDSTNNVWVDALGQLHVRIINRSNQWQCAEIVSARTFGYGTYRFELASTVNNVNPNAVLGVFSWSDDPVFADREIDIECSRWGNAADTNNAQYVVQPFDTSGHLVRIAVPAAETNSAHQFSWKPPASVIRANAGTLAPTLCLQRSSPTGRIPSMSLAAATKMCASTSGSSTGRRPPATTNRNL